MMDRRFVALLQTVLRISVTGGIGVDVVVATEAAEPFAWEQGSGFRRAKLSVSAQGRAGFTLLNPSETGITFVNRLSPLSAAANNNLMNGSGAAAGDIDGDGWCDLYFCSLAGTNALYRNLGGWRFQEITREAGVAGGGWQSTGALLADVDGDGDLDLLVATLGQGAHLFLNEGHLRFREATADAGLGAPTGSTSMAMADVDGDGDLDLYVANYGALSILRSGGRADLKKVGDQWTVTGPYSRRLRFVNGHLEELGEPDTLYLNDGRGHFTPVPWGSDTFLDEDGKPKPEPWDFGLTVQMRDVNSDRCPDIYVCNDFQTVDRFWLNDGHGHFRAMPRLALRKQCFSAMGVDFADIDRDGDLDFMVTEMMSRQHSRRMRQMVGLPPLIPVAGRIDNRPEVARNVLNLNRGDLTFAEVANFSGVAAGDWAWQPVFLDVDLDGYEDLLIGNGMMYDVQDRDTLSQIRSLGRQTPEQSRTNLLLYPPFLTPNAAYRNGHDLTFSDVSQAWGFNATPSSQGFALADFDHDGDLDVAINCLNAAPLLYRNNSPAPRVTVRLKGRSPNTRGIGSVVRLLGGAVPLQFQEILAGGHYLSGSDALRVFAAGAGTNDLTLQVAWRGGGDQIITNIQPNWLYELDENAATRPAAESGHSATTHAGKEPAPTWFEDVSGGLGHIHAEMPFNDYARQPLLYRQLSQLGPGIGWLDLDQDGQDELAIGTGRGGRLAVAHRAGTGGFVLANADSPGPAPDDVTGLAAWTTAEGRPALLAGLATYESGLTNGWAVMLCTSDPGRNSYPIVPIGTVPARGASPGALATADFDGDGRLELFVAARVIPGAFPTARGSALYRWIGDQLTADETSASLFEGAGMVSAAVWVDLEDDGFPELILACEWGPVRILRNTRGKLAPWDPPIQWAPIEPGSESGPSEPDPRLAPTKIARFEDLSGWWNSVAAGDFDEDGRMDLVVGNWGLNTGYDTSPEHPLRLYHGDVGGLGVIDLVESYYAPELNANVPRRSLNALTQAFPMVAEHIRSHEAFGTVTVEQLLGWLPTRPEQLQVNTLLSLLLLNRGTHFIAQPLPVEAQLAPIFGMNVGDADGDGHEDVFVAQNLFALRPEWPRLDSGRGLWLKGDGRGGLTPVPGQVSGVMVYGEQRGSALGDFDQDGRVDLAVTQNGAQTRLFRNRAAAPGLRVRVAGPPGNPLGLGVRIRLESGGRLGPVREIHGSSGYWSQDSPVQIMARPAASSRIHALWPGGQRTETPVPRDGNSVVISAPK